VTGIGPGKSLEQEFSVWSKEFKTPGTVLLGALSEVGSDSPPRQVEWAMYGIAATRLSAKVPEAPPSPAHDAELASPLDQTSQ
jgi:hypothetical protein